MTQESKPRQRRRIGPGRYHEYIQSQDWYETCLRYRCSGLPQQCYACGDPRSSIYHRTYERLGDERLTDLIPLCDRCRIDTNAIFKGRRANARQTPEFKGTRLWGIEDLTRQRRQGEGNRTPSDWDDPELSRAHREATEDRRERRERVTRSPRRLARMSQDG